jgi:starch-binding outer membrane protein, SusD/RagB family
MWHIFDRKARASAVAVRAGVFAVVLLGLAGCDFTVTNPGPVQDRNLEDPATHEPLVTGAMRSTLLGFSAIAHRAGAVVREFQPSGGTGAGGITREIELGRLSDEVTLPGWDRLQQGRWVAESGAERIRELMGDRAGSYGPLGRAYLWAGFANRILGEHSCSAVFDGGPAEAYTQHFVRAIDQFTEAAKILGAAGDQNGRLAAIGARAAAYAYLGRWAEAVADANAIPFDYAYEVKYTGRSTPDTGTDGERWRITLGMNGFYRSVSFRHTQWESYFPQTGDPRAGWGFDQTSDATRFGETPRTTFGSGAAGRIFYYYPLKFYSPRNPDERTSWKPNPDAMYQIPVNLVSGKEMVLIRAEAALASGDVAQGMALINQVRQSYENYFTGETLAPATASNLGEAWTALKRERGIELLLEGRRFGDLRRWQANNTPGELHPLEYVLDRHVQTFDVPRQQVLCSPIPRSEKERNANIPLDFRDW